jgi:plastocyanin domain-containing protein
MKATVISIIVAGLIIGGVIVYTKNAGSTGATSVGSANNVSLVEGKQIIQINTKGGYEPHISVTKAGVPTILRFNTNGTFDCSSVVRIPSLNITKILPQTGTTDIDIGTQQASTLQGMCGMGMYRFEVQFSS